MQPFKPRTFPATLTSYDLLKTLAVVLMVVDHLGYYFFPDENWFRVFGRLCVPIWFFLIGYARTRDLDPRMLVGAGLLVAGSIVYGHYIFPLNILATMLVIRLVLDRVMNFSLKSDAFFMFICLALYVLVLPSNFILEYGTQGLILAMFGYLLRHRAEIARSQEFINYFAFFTLFAFVTLQFVMHGFTMPQFYVLTGGTASVLYMLYNFRPAELAGRMPGFVAALLKFTGRRTLEIYVLHILLFAGIALALGDERFGLFQWKLMPEL